MLPLAMGAKIPNLFFKVFFFYKNIYKWLTITSKKLTKENKKNETISKTSDKYAYSEMLHIIADISNTTFQKS